jgi:hypothetical protein
MLAQRHCGGSEQEIKCYLGPQATVSTREPAANVRMEDAERQQQWDEGSHCFMSASEIFARRVAQVVPADRHPTLGAS